MDNDRSRSERPNFFHSVGRFAHRWRWIVIGLWVCVFGFALVFAPRLHSVLKAGSLLPSYTESYKADQLLKQAIGQPPSSLTVLFTSDSLTVDDPRFQAEMNANVSQLSSLPEVTRVITFANGGGASLISQDRHTTVATIDLNVSSDTATLDVPQIRSKLKSGQVKTLVTGTAPIYSDIITASERDLAKSERSTLPLALVALVIVFGSLVGASVPLVIGGLSVALTLALMYFIGHRVETSVFVMNSASMLGLGVAIDYSLFIVSRFREELRRNTVPDSLAITMGTAGRAVFFSGMTTTVGLLGLLLFPFTTLSSVGMGGAVVVAISVLAALTLLPASLSLLGERVNSLRIVPTSWGAGGFWHHLASFVMRYPVLVLVPVVALLITLGTPFLKVDLGEPGAKMLPTTSESRAGLDLLYAKFGEGNVNPIEVVVHGDTSLLSSPNVAALYDFTRQIAKDKRVSRVDSIVNLDPSISEQQYQLLYSNPSQIPDPRIATALKQFGSGTTTLIHVYAPYPATSKDAKGLVRAIRQMQPPDHLRVYVGGATADTMDMAGVIYSIFPRVLLLVIAIIYLVLLVLFRSPVLSLKAVLMTALSILASYGALVFIFQEGHLSSFLGFTPQGVVESSLPVLIFCILFGLSMDYEVFLLTRIKEVYDATGDNTQSVALGLERTGRIITSAALIMVLITGSFAFTDVVFIKALGVGIALAIFLDATVVRALLVPATMRLLGNLNWWTPRWLKRALDSFGSRGQTPYH